MRYTTIAHHEDIQRGRSLRAWMAEMWRAWGRGDLPAYEAAQGTVAAYVNEGRWVADCPEGCGNALCVSEREPYFLCHVCGSPANGGRWYRVEFPASKRLIESALLKRPLSRSRLPTTRNWRPGETPTQLRAENRAHGLED